MKKIKMHQIKCIGDHPSIGFTITRVHNGFIYTHLDKSHNMMSSVYVPIGDDYTQDDITRLENELFEVKDENS